MLFKWKYGFASFGLSTDLSNTMTAGQDAAALILLRVQDLTGSRQLNLHAINAAGGVQDLGATLGTALTKIEIDYVVGDATATVTFNNGVPIANVALRNPGGVVAGFFFTDWDEGIWGTGGVNTITDYFVDDLLITSDVPEPASLALLGLGSLLMLRRRSRTQ